MKENRAVGPNLKTYYYYTNKMADEENVKGIIVIATGIEATGSIYDEIGDYLDKKGFAMYAIDEWGYGNTGKIVKENFKNWTDKDFHFAAYNVHALSVLAKSHHQDAPVYLIGNDFGAMLALYLIREFPEVVDKVVTIGWGAPRGQDYGFLFGSWLKKVLFYDESVSKTSHISKNKRFALRFERGDKYSWLTSDKDQLKKIKDAGFIDEPGTVRHYYNYYKNKVKVPLFTRSKKCDKDTPILFVSGDEDLLTMKGVTTKQLVNIYKRRKFNNVSYLSVSGRHEILFEKNRFDNLEIILKWLDNSVEKENIKISQEKNEAEIIDNNINVMDNTIITPNEEEIVVDVEIKETPDSAHELQEADDELLINTNKESE